MKSYVALIEVDENIYGVVFPDFPGLTTVGNSYEEAVQLAHEALAFHTKALISDGEKLPRPRSLKEIKTTWEDWKDWENSDYFAANIALLPSYGTQKILVTMDANLVAKIDAITKNRSAFLTSAVESFFAAAIPTSGNGNRGPGL